MPESSPGRRRRRYVLSLRALLVLVLVVGGGLGWFVHKARVRREAVAAIVAAGGHAYYDWEFPDDPSATGPPKPPWPEWLVDALGVDALCHVDWVHVSDDKHEVDGALLDQIGRLDRLKTLDLMAWKLDDATLAHLRGFGRLEELDLSWCHDLTDAGIAPLGGLRRLRRLRLPLSPGRIKGPGLASLRGLDRLEALEMGGIAPGDDDLAHLAGLASLRYLVVAGDRLTDRGLVHLGGLVRLEGLKLEGHPAEITAAGLAHLSGLRRLEGLILHDSCVKSLGPLGRLDRLKVLDVSGAPIDDDGLAAVAGLRALEQLDLTRTRVGPAGLAHLAGLDRLKLLIIEGSAVTDASLGRLAGLPGLERLSLRGRPGLTDSGLAKLAGLSRLKAVEIDLFWYEPKDVAALREAMPGTKFVTR